MSDTTYNGWTNRATWLVSIWFNPEKPSDLDYAKDFLEEEHSSLSSYMQDLVELHLINWDELKASLVE